MIHSIKTQQRVCKLDKILVRFQSKLVIRASSVYGLLNNGDLIIKSLLGWIFMCFGLVL